MLTAALLCLGPVIHVTDADTLRVGGDCPALPIRVADVDAPEMRGPCRELGEAATWLVRSEFGPWEGLDGVHVEVRERDRDRWGRVVAEVTIVEGVWRGWTYADAVNAAAEIHGMQPPLRSWRHVNGRAVEPRPWRC